MSTTFRSIDWTTGWADDRNLWPACLRIMRECGANFFLGENVYGIITNGYAFEVLAGLEEAGYCAIPTINTSCSVGGPFSRKRVFFIAHAKSLGLDENEIHKTDLRKNIIKRRDGRYPPTLCFDLGRFGSYSMAVDLRMGDGLETRLDEIGSRIKACGNGVDPYSVYPAWEKIIAMSEANP